jgi:hypothetical protein
MYQRREYREDEQITVGFKATGKLATAVHAAAEKAGYPSTTQWLRSLALEGAAKTLGVTAESLEPSKKRTRPSVAPSPEEAAHKARINAALLDAEETIKRLTAAMREAGVEAPTVAKPIRRR